MDGKRLTIALKNAWAGKDFVYISKYGSETKGVVKDVVIVNEMIMDSNSLTSSND